MYQSPGTDVGGEALSRGTGQDVSRCVEEGKTTELDWGFEGNRQVFRFFVVVKFEIVSCVGKRRWIRSG